MFKIDSFLDVRGRSIERNRKASAWAGSKGIVFQIRDLDGGWG